MVISGADSRHPAMAESAGTSGGAQPAVETRAAPGGARTTTIRLPLISATFTRSARPDRQQTPSAGRVPAVGATPAGVPGLRGVSLPRVAFYAGAVALGALGALEVVEWPVTLLVVAGTYVADRARGTVAAAGSAPPAAGQPIRAAVPIPSAAAQRHVVGG